MKTRFVSILSICACMSASQAATWQALTAPQNPQPPFQTAQPVAPRFWHKHTAEPVAWPFGSSQQPPMPLLFWSRNQTGLYDNPWTPVWRDGWWSPPVHWSTPLAPWTQYQLYQWWNNQVAQPFHTTQPKPMEKNP